MAEKTFLILGCGYTGKWLDQWGSSKVIGAKIHKTSRELRPENIQFQLEDAATWKNLPEVEGTFWTFPAEPLPLVESFLSEMRQKLGQIVVIGTTGSYPAENGITINELSPLEMSEARVQGEEKIRNAGGSVVRASGIYGKGRSPLEWIRTGRIGPSEKLVNFIHVYDLAGILWSAMLRGRPRENYLASDGQPYTWRNLFEIWKTEYGFPEPTQSGVSKRASKRVDPTWSLRELGYDLRFKTVVEGVRSLDPQLFTL